MFRNAVKIYKKTSLNVVLLQWNCPELEMKLVFRKKTPHDEKSVLLFLWFFQSIISLHALKSALNKSMCVSDDEQDISKLRPNVTRLTSHSHPNLNIENIFSSVINDDCIAGSLISPISDHHTWFLMIPNYTIFKKIFTNKILSIVVPKNLRFRKSKLG